METRSLADIAIPNRSPGAIEARWQKIPSAIKRKLTHLEDRAATLYGASNSFWGRITSAREELAAARETLRRAQEAQTPKRIVAEDARDIYTGAPGTGVVTIGSGPPPPEMYEAIERLEAEVARLDAAWKPAAQRAGEARKLSDAAKRWIDEIADPAAIVVVRVPPTGVPREDRHAEIEKARARLIAIDDDVQAVERAPVPVVEAQERLRVLLARLVDGGHIHVGGLFTPRGVTHLAQLFRLPDGNYSPSQLAEAHRDLFNLVLALAHDEVAKVLAKGIAAYEPTKPISSADRPKRLAKLAQERTDLYVREETLILETEADGLDADRRGDAEPGVVLTTSVDQKG